jgi:hypothetical protein
MVREILLKVMPIPQRRISINQTVWMQDHTNSVAKWDGTKIFTSNG